MENETLQDIQRTIEKSKEAHPGSDLFTRRNGIVQEYGEALQALAKWELAPGPLTKMNLKTEILQAIGCSIRFLEEVLLLEDTSPLAKLEEYPDIKKHKPLSHGSRLKRVGNTVQWYAQRADGSLIACGPIFPIPNDFVKDGSDAQCPVCGFYCLGKGGVFCIDKPSLLH